MQVDRSSELADVLDDVRGPVLAEAQRLEAEGHRVLELDTGDPSRRR